MLSKEPERFRAVILCQIVTGTYKKNVSSLLGIFTIIQSIHPSICQPINNKLQR